MDRRFDSLQGEGFEPTTLLLQDLSVSNALAIRHGRLRSLLHNAIGDIPSERRVEHAGGLKRDLIGHRVEQPSPSGVVPMKPSKQQVGRFLSHQLHDCGMADPRDDTETRVAA